MPKSFLGDISEKDRRWDKHKNESMAIAKLFDKAELTRKAERIRNCSNEMSMAVITKEDNTTLKLRTANFCRVRECALCQWRRSLKWRSRVFAGLPKLYTDFPRQRWLFLTLTTPNCPVNELRATMKLLNDGFVRLTRFKAFPGQGWIKSVEVTRNPETDMAHPHLHILMMVNSSYYSGAGYIKHSEWTELWQKAMRFTFIPIVNIKSVPDCKNDFEKLTKNICEITKYQVKPGDLSYDPTWLAELSRQLENSRAISLGGVFRDYFKEIGENEDLVFIDDENSISSSECDDSPRLQFSFSAKHSRYMG